jgi:hypothetical protein
MRYDRKTARSYAICTDRSKIKGTDNFQIGPGRYSDKNWGEGAIFIDEASFVVVEGIIKRHFKKYMHDEINNISKTKGWTIIASLREAAASVPACKNKDILDLIEYTNDHSPNTVSEFIKGKDGISKMLGRLADYMENAYEANEWVCVVRL